LWNAKNVHESLEAYCEEVESTIRLYGVAIARNVVVDAAFDTTTKGQQEQDQY
jgi:hypothetical protein